MVQVSELFPFLMKYIHTILHHHFTPRVYTTCKYTVMDYECLRHFVKFTFDQHFITNECETMGINIQYIYICCQKIQKKIVGTFRNRSEN